MFIKFPLDELQILIKAIFCPYCHCVNLFWTKEKIFFYCCISFNAPVICLSRTILLLGVGNYVYSILVHDMPTLRHSLCCAVLLAPLSSCTVFILCRTRCANNTPRATGEEIFHCFYSFFPFPIHFRNYLLKLNKVLTWIFFNSLKVLSPLSSSYPLAWSLFLHWEMASKWREYWRDSPITLLQFALHTNTARGEGSENEVQEQSKDNMRRFVSEILIFRLAFPVMINSVNLF